LKSNSHFTAGYEKVIAIFSDIFYDYEKVLAIFALAIEKL